jgi:hypothetical protein
MATLHLGRSNPNIPFYIEDPTGQTIRCRRAGDGNVIAMVENSDNILVVCPHAPQPTKAMRDLGERLGQIHRGEYEPQYVYDEEKGQIEVGLSHERDALARQDHRQILVASATFETLEGSKTIAVICLAPTTAPACDLAVALP